MFAGKAKLLFFKIYYTKSQIFVYFIIYMIYLFYRVKDKKLLFKFGVITLISSGIFLLPFIIWNPLFFWNDTFRYISGGLTTSYPVSGFGFSMLLVISGFLKNPNDYNALIFQAIFALPILVLSVYLIKKYTTIRMSLVCFGMLFLALTYFSRFFEDSYLGVAVQIFILAYFVLDKNESVNK